MPAPQPTPAHASARSPIGEWLAVAGITAIALYFRCSDLQWMEFKGDEAIAMQIARDMLDGGGIALTGLVSSLGVPNPPVFVYWMASVMLWTRDPVLVTGLAVALPGTLAVFLTWWVLRRRTGIWLRLSAPLLMAVAPWAVLYSRKIWAQDVMPVLCVALLGTLARISERPRTRAVFWVPILIASLWQIHFSATGLALVAAVLLAFQIRNLRWTALLAGTAVALATLGPYITHLQSTGFEDLGTLTKSSQEGGAVDRDRVSLASVAAVTAREVASISADTNLDYALGKSSADFAEHSGAGGLPLLRDAGGRLAVLCLALGAALLTWWVLRASRLLRHGFGRTPDALGAGSSRRPFDTVLWIWIGVYAGYLWIGNVERIYPHYFVALYPVPFILIAMPLDFLAREGGRAGRAGAGALLALIVASHVGTLGAFRSYIHERGGTGGDYGVAYHHKKALVDWVVESNATIVARRGREYSFLQGAVPRTSEATGGTRIAIIDHLRSGPEVPAQCGSIRRFGPLSACILD